MFRNFKLVVEQYVKSVIVSGSKSETLSPNFLMYNFGKLFKAKI